MSDNTGVRKELEQLKGMLEKYLSEINKLLEPNNEIKKDSIEKLLNDIQESENSEVKDLSRLEQGRKIDKNEESDGSEEFMEEEEMQQDDEAI